MREHKLRLNSSKCVFGVGSMKFLGYIVTQRGVEVNPDQIKVIKNLYPPRTPKEVQRLTRMAATLNKFISRPTVVIRFPSYLKGQKIFEWSESCNKAFEKLKKYLTSPPLLSRPRPRLNEPLYAYLSVSSHVVSAIFLKMEGKKQELIFYVSKTLVDAETKYLHLEKIALVLYVAAKKLPHYFQSHTINVITKYPLRTLLERSDFSGGISKWGALLGAFEIRYISRSIIKW
jgi:CRISPR/Cas system-associated protein Cas10 (large subunit of type III CRISPR-Cas system)